MGLANDPASPFDGKPLFTWAIMMMDVNGDGLMDIVEANDQFGPVTLPGAVARGYNQIFVNQGEPAQDEKRFISEPFGFVGSWMGLCQGDLNGDEKLDIYVSNFGSYARWSLTTFTPGPPFQLNYPSRPFFRDESKNGGFDPDYVDYFDFAEKSPFGWGCAIYDLDNDNDLDILVHGGLDGINLGVIADNPGTIVENGTYECL